MLKHLTGLFICGASVAACSDASAPKPGLEGPAVAIEIAALSLQGAGDVVWDLEVVNGRTPTPDVVWRQRITASRYGDGVGSTSYVGPCDASAGVNQNTVRLWVVGVYDADVSAANAGAFAAGATTGVVGTALPFQNPTTAGPLTRTVTCSPNADARVTFDVTLMRPAEQGFFDIAVNFDDLFCAAKYDCCYDAAGDGCAGDGSEDIDLLFDASGQRQRTHILGFACTAGVTSGVVTELFMDDLVLDCDVSSSGATFAPDVTLDPNATHEGNQCVPGANGMSACAAVSEAAGVDADTYLYQFAVYRGDELLPNAGGGNAHIAYWNLALGVKGPIAGCTLRTRATADDSADLGDQVNQGVIADGKVYPFVTFNVPLGTCGSEPLTFGDPSAPVGAGYTGTTTTNAPFGYFYTPEVRQGAVCSPACQNGGQCIGPGECDCTGTGFPEPYCAATCDPACEHGGVCVDTNLCDCDGTGYVGATCTTPVCDPSCVNGTCSAPNTCTCAGGYTGPTCATPTCSGGCLNGGSCSAPDTCTCVGGYSGANCQIPPAPTCTGGCLNGGTCIANDTCSCAGGYTGANCQIPPAPTCTGGCLNGGTCIATDTCSCIGGYTGANCQTPPGPTCNPSCQNGGTCTATDTCTCINGYTGATCQTPPPEVCDGVDNDFDSDTDEGCAAFARDIAVDGAGKIWLAIRSDDSASVLRPAILKLDSGGNVESGFPVYVPGYTLNWAVAIGLDSALRTTGTGSAYLTSGAAPDAGGNRFAAFKVNQAGVFATSPWPAVDALNLPQAYDIALDASDNIFAVGYTPGPGNTALWKISTAGSIQAGFPKTQSAGAPGKEQAWVNVVDGSGNVWVVGKGVDSEAGSQETAFLLKYNGAGTLQAGFPKQFYQSGTTLVPPVGRINPQGAVFDSAGNFWVVGNVGTPTQDTVMNAVWKFDSAGTLQSGFPKLRSSDVGGGTSVSNAFTCAVSAGGGEIWAAGLASIAASGISASDERVTLYRLNASGNPVAGYPKVFNSPGGLGGGAIACALDASGNVLLAGYALDASGRNQVGLWKTDGSGNLLAGFPKVWKPWLL